MPGTAFVIFVITPFGMKMSPGSAVSNVTMLPTEAVVRFSDRTSVLELVSSTASITMVSLMTVTWKSLSVMAVPRASRASLVLCFGSGVMVYRFPLRATPRAVVAAGDARITVALLKDALVISASALETSFVAGLVSDAIDVPTGIAVPSTPVQRML